MRSFWSDPYLWIHLAGLASLPIFLGLCLIGFATGDPILPVWLEILLVGLLGIGPVLWMQWQRPFYIFSLVAVVLKPEQLTEDQRRLLTLFLSQRNRVLAAIVPGVLLVVLKKLYDIAPIAAGSSPFPTDWRLVGLLVAGLSFFACNLFTQVPVSVASVMFHSDSTVAATDPYPLDQVRSHFTLLGWPVNQILPPVIPDLPVKPMVPAPAPPPIAAPAAPIETAVPESAVVVSESEEVPPPAPESSPPDGESPETDLWA
jgi:hypothetical protein